MSLTEILVDDTTTALSSPGINATDVTIPVAAVPSTLTAATQTRIRIDNEWMLVTYQDATHLSVVGGTAGRGIEGSTAASHSTASEIDFVATRDGMTQALSPAVNLSGALLASTEYNPASTQTVNTTSTSIASVDSTNLTCSFVAPNSGRVVVELSIFVQPDVSNNAYLTELCVKQHGTSTQLGNAYAASQLISQSISQNQRVRQTVQVPISGLTGGTTYTIDMAYFTQNAASNGALLYGGNVGPALIAVYDGTVASGGIVAVTAALNDNDQQASLVSGNSATDHFFGSSLASKWTQTRTAPTVSSVGNSELAIQCSGSGATDFSTPYAPGASVALRVETKILINGAGGLGAGLWIGTSNAWGTGDGMLMWFNTASAGTVVLYSLDSGTVNQRQSIAAPWGINPGHIYLRLDRNSSNSWTGYCSLDRQNWISLGSYSKTLTPAFLGVEGQSGSDNYVAWDFVDVVDGTQGTQQGIVTTVAPGRPGQTLTVDPSGLPSWSSGVESLRLVSASGAAQTIDVSVATVQDITLSANCTFTLAGAVSGRATSLTVVVRQDGTGGWTLTWPGSVSWPSGSAPVVPTAANAAQVFALITLDGGTTWFGGDVAPALDTNAAHIAPVGTTAGAGAIGLGTDSGHTHVGVHSLVAGSGISISSATGDVTVTATGGGGGGSGLIGKTTYNPGTQVNSNPGTSLAAVDSTNLSLTFTAPSSGNVDVVLESFLFPASNSNGDWMAWGLVTHGTTTLVGNKGIVCQKIGQSTSEQTGFQGSLRIALTGLTGGTSYTLDWAFQTSSTASTQAQMSYGGSLVGAATMRAYDAS